MIKFGTLEGAKEHVSTLQTFLKELGPTGSITLDLPAGERIIQITPTVKVQVQVPFKVDFEQTDTEITLKFKATGYYRFLKRPVEYIKVNLDRITIGLTRFPDGYLDVR